MSREDQSMTRSVLGSNPAPGTRDVVLFGVAILYSLGILIVDINIELGVAAAVLHVIVIWISSLTNRIALVWAAVGVAILVTFLGYFVSPDGGETWTVIANRALAVLAIVSTAYLVHQRLRAEQARREQDKAILTEMVDKVIDGMIIMSDSGEVISANRAGEVIFGYSADEFVGLRLEALVPELDQQAMAHTAETFHNRVAAEFPDRGHEAIGRRKDGSAVPIDLTISEIKGKSGVTYIAILRDITERRIAEDRLKQTLQRLQFSNEELEKFAFAASHDLKSPLQNIGNLVNWLHEDLADKIDRENLEMLDKLRRTTDRMLRLLADMLAYARADRVEEEGELHPLSEIVDGILELIPVPDGIRIVQDDALGKVRVQRVPIQQVLHNLIGNAVKHHGSSGEVVISARQTADMLEFSVSDDGQGIPEQYHDRIFGIFQTLKPRDEVEGSGIGLALVKKIVQRRQGEINLISSDGEGTRFVVRWPLRPDAKQSPGD